MYWIQEQYEIERHKDFVREAERQQLAAEVRAAQRPSPRIYQPMLNALGVKLIEWGTRLQDAREVKIERPRIAPNV